MFSDLPQELLLAICGYVTLQDMGSLRRVSKMLEQIISPMLFNTITFNLDEIHYEGLDVTPTGYKKDYEALKTSGCFGLIKHLHFRLPFHERALDRWHHHPESFRDDNSPILSELQGRLNPLLEQLEDHSLLSFRIWRSWDLGLCVPRELLGPRGYLPWKQASIRSLSLITSVECSNPKKDNAEPILLTRFDRIRKFSWKRLQSPREYQTLRGFLCTNSKILDDFTVESGRPEPKYGPATRGRDSIKFVLPCTPDNSSQCFPPLRSLSVSGFSFNATDEMKTPMIDFSRLRSLALQNCTDTPLLFRNVLESGQHIALKHLDLKFEDRIYQGWNTSILLSFLQAFEGLEDLYLMIDPVLPTEVYWDSTTRHHWTLKRFLYHERGTDIGRYSHNLELKIRYSDAALKWGNKNRAYPWLMYPWGGIDADSSPAEFESAVTPLHSILAATTLDCLALCDSPAVLRKVLESYVSQLTFTLLHVRRTARELPYDLLETIEKWIRLGSHGENPYYLSSFSVTREYNLCMGLFDLLNWAFGPGGPPRLQVLAFGDFSHDGRFPKQSILFCRQPLPSSKITWRLAKRDETAIFDGIDRPWEFLGACPRDATMPWTCVQPDNVLLAWPGRSS